MKSCSELPALKELAQRQCQGTTRLLRILLKGDFIVEIYAVMERRMKKDFDSLLPSDAAIMADPRKVKQGLSALYKRRMFVYGQSKGCNNSLIRADYYYASPKSECDKWIEFEAHV